MKVLLINPNSDHTMTENIRQLVSSFPTDYIETTVIGMKNTPFFINSEETILATFKEVSQTILEKENLFDIFILACHLDPNLEKLRQITKKMILGIGQCSVLYSEIWNKRYSIIGSSSQTVSLKTKMVENYGAQKMMDTVGYPEDNEKGNLCNKLLHASAKAIETHDTEAIVLGCAGFVGMDSYLEKQLNIPVIDGVITALMAADSFAKYKNYKKTL